MADLERQPQPKVFRPDESIEDPANIPDVIVLSLSPGGIWKESREPQRPWPGADPDCPLVLYLLEDLDINLRDGLLAPDPMPLCDFKLLSDYHADIQPWPAYYNSQHQLIEKKIRSVHPWNAPTEQNPAELRLNHEFYKHVSRFQAQYRPVRKSEGTKQVTHALNQRLTMWFGRRETQTIGIILFYPAPVISIQKVEYRFFQGEEAFVKESPQFKQLLPSLKGQRDRFRLEVKTTKIDINRAAAACHAIILKWAIEDREPVYDELSATLDTIELSLSQDSLGGQLLHQWWSYSHHWRVTLYHERRTLKHLEEDIVGGSGSLVDLLPPSVISKLMAIREDSLMLSNRLDNTFQTLMTTMQIVESEQAINEAKLMSKLTQLAFFFVPINLITGVFGMDVLELEHKPSLTLWVGVSAADVYGSYMAL